MAEDPAKDWEDVRTYGLDETEEDELPRRQTECTFMWNSTSGYPMGVVVNFIFGNGRFWLTATDQRPRIAAVRKDPRVSVAVTSKGSGITASRALSYKGDCAMHKDEETKAWFFPAFAAAMRPDSPEKAASFAAHLDSPGRLVLEIVPQGRIGFDSSKMWQAAPSAAPLP